MLIKAVVTFACVNLEVIEYRHAVHRLLCDSVSPLIVFEEASNCASVFIAMQQQSGLSR